MAVYDYECRTCGQEFQVVEKISDHGRHRPKCPKCKSVKVERVFTGAFVKTGRKS